MGKAPRGCFDSPISTGDGLYVEKYPTTHGVNKAENQPQHEREYHNI